MKAIKYILIIFLVFSSLGFSKRFYSDFFEYPTGTPESPQLVSPQNGNSSSGSSLIVKWNKKIYTSHYAIIVAKDSQFSDVIVHESAIADTTFPLYNLEENTTYYWKVCGSNVAGSGDFSDTWTFTTSGALPVEMRLFTAVQTDKGVELEWQTATEENNVGFIVERSIDKKSWEEIASYKTHGRLNGQGTTTKETSYSFIDENVEYGATYFYRLGDVNTGGVITMNQVIQVSCTNKPEYTTLHQAYPNPFNPQTKITYQLSEMVPVEIAIYDILSRKVATLVDKSQSPGHYSTVWFGKNDMQQRVSTGLYFVVMQAGQKVMTQKVVLVK